MDKTVLSAQDLLEDSFRLGLDVLESGFEPTLIIAIWRGGTPVGMAVQEVLEYDRSEMPAVEAKTGGVFTHIKIKDESRPFVAKFHRMGMKENRRHCQEIEAALVGAAA